jgi:hypothetical protein
MNQSDNFYLKSHEDDFEKDIIWMIGPESFIFEIMLNHKSINVLLMLNFNQMLFWFNVFIDNMRDLINVSNINIDHIKKILSDIFINTKC